MQQEIDQPLPVTEACHSLVLSGGGARAAYQVGALTLIAERVADESTFPIITGVSAGAINSGAIASHNGTLKGAVALLRRSWLRMSVSKVFRTETGSFLSSGLKLAAKLASAGKAPGLDIRGLLDTAPLRKTLSGQIGCDRISANIESGRLRALGLSATSYSTGRSVTFVHGAEGTPTWRRAGRVAVRARINQEHVLASCALPLVFPAVEIGGQHYGDGSIRQLAPLAPAIHLGATKLLVLAVRYRPGLDEEAREQITGYPPAAQILGMMMNSVFLEALEYDRERLERINRSLESLAPGRVHPEGLRPLKLEVLRPSRDLGELAAGLEEHLPPALRRVLRGLGSRTLRSQDMLSYLLFERPYIERLIELGYNDARSEWDRLERHLDPTSDGLTATA